MRTLVKALPLAVAVVVAWIVLRWFQEAPVAAPAPTLLGYRLPVGERLAFVVTNEDHDLALSVHLEMPAARPSPETLRFATAVAVEDKTGQVLWKGHAVLQATPDGAIADGKVPLTAAQTLRVDLPPDLVEGRLVVVVEPGLDATQRGAAVVRLVRRTHQPHGWRTNPPSMEARTRALGDRASPFGWPYLDREVLAEIHEEPLTRRAADDRDNEHQLVHVRLIPRERDVPAPGEPGELILPDDAAAWTVRGPGSTRLSVVPAGAVDTTPLLVTVRTVDNKGAVTEATMEVPSGGLDHHVDVPDGGALTVAVLTDDERGARARVFMDRGATQLGKLSGLPCCTPTQEISPDRRSHAVWRVRPGSPALRATLAGDGTARVLARAVLEAAPGLPGAVWPAPVVEPRLAWRILDGDKVIAQGDVGVPAVPAPFEKLTAEGTSGVPTTEPLSFVAAGPPGTLLELSAKTGALDVALEAADDPPPDFRFGPDARFARLAPEYEVPLDGARLRFAPYARKSWVGFRPDNHAELTAAGARVELEGQVRLDPAGPSRPTGGPWKSVDPYGPRTRHVLVEREDQAPSRWRRHHRVGFPVGEATRVTVPGDGPDAGRLALDYFLGPEALGGTLYVFVDGQRVNERRLTVTRGRVRLTGLTPGAREVRLDGPPGVAFTAARLDGSSLAAGEAGVFAERVVWRTGQGGTLTVPVSLAEGEGRTLNVVFYTDESASDAGTLKAHALIDSGAKGPALRSTGGRTRMLREVTLVPAPTTTRWLDRQSGPRASAHFAVTLGPDLGPGVHNVQVTLDQSPARVHARFFVTGYAGESVVTHVGTEFDAD
jgi:hypothetical protein